MTKEELCKEGNVILSYGGGVQTTAMLYMNPKRYKALAFSDTGNEHPETYQYINDYIIPFCKLNGIDFIRVYNSYGKTLYEYCYDKKIVPSMKYRDCTFKFKIYPIRRLIRILYKATRFKPEIVDIGISFDESDRMNESKVQYIKNEYPLIDGKFNRRQLKKIIRILGFPVPIKSGCWFCPYSRRYDKRFHNQVIKLEENNSRFPEILLKGMANKKVKPIRQLLEQDVDITCTSGYCFV